NSILVADHGQRTSVWRERNAFDVPPCRMTEIGESAARQIEVREPLKLAVTIGCEEKSASVARELRLGAGHLRSVLAPAVDDLPARAGPGVHEPHAHLGGRDLPHHGDSAIIE